MSRRSSKAGSGTKTPNSSRIDSDVKINNAPPGSCRDSGYSDSCNLSNSANRPRPSTSRHNNEPSITFNSLLKDCPDTEQDLPSRQFKFRDSSSKLSHEECGTHMSHRTSSDSRTRPSRDHDDGYNSGHGDIRGNGRGDRRDIRSGVKSSHNDASFNYKSAHGPDHTGATHHRRQDFSKSLPLNISTPSELTSKKVKSTSESSPASFVSVKPPVRRDSPNARSQHDTPAIAGKVRSTEHRSKKTKNGQHSDNYSTESTLIYDRNSPIVISEQNNNAWLRNSKSSKSDRETYYNNPRDGACLSESRKQGAEKDRSKYRKSGMEYEKEAKDLNETRKSQTTRNRSDKGVSEENNSNSDITTERRLYKDTPENRKVGRVGKPLGSAVLNRKTGEMTVELYIDSPLNRRYERVGLPRGSKPSIKKSPMTKKIPQYVDQIEKREKCDSTGITEDDKAARGYAQCKVNKDIEEDNWGSKPKTLGAVIAKYSGATIPFSDLDLHRKIGQGGFGEIFFAKFKGSVVAVKTLRHDKAAGKEERKFKEEIENFCKLDHPNIVKFIGASIEQSHMSIVMEYMQMSLYDALNVCKNIDFSEETQLKLIKEMCRGLLYLHVMKNMAHCDLKPQNVLLDCVDGNKCTAKISDFGLSMVSDVVPSGSKPRTARYIGTPRYWAPEVMRGNRLTADDMMKTDIYSLALIIYELVYAEEPFYNVNRDQMLEEVGKKGMTPEMPEEMKVDRKVSAAIRKAWSYQSEKRPNISHLEHAFAEMNRIYSHYK